MREGLFKVEGAGNDFLLGTGKWAKRLAGDRALVQKLCRRRLCFGADGTLALFPDGDDAVRVVYRNADGGEATFCANGTRCAARAAVMLLDRPRHLIVRTAWAGIPADVDGEDVRLKLPSPPKPPRRLTLQSFGRTWDGWLLEVGVPHLVVPVSGDLSAFDIDRWGPSLRFHRALGDAGANVTFVGTTGKSRIAVRSWERGVEAETLSCGSGVVATALIWMGLHGGPRLACDTRSGQTLSVQALGTPPQCAALLLGPAHILGELVVWED